MPPTASTPPVPVVRVVEVRDARGAEEVAVRSRARGPGARRVRSAAARAGAAGGPEIEIRRGVAVVVVGVRARGAGRRRAGVRAGGGLAPARDHPAASHALSGMSPAPRPPRRRAPGAAARAASPAPAPAALHSSVRSLSSVSAASSPRAAWAPPEAPEGDESGAVRRGGRARLGAARGASRRRARRSRSAPTCRPDAARARRCCPNQKGPPRTLQRGVAGRKRDDARERRGARCAARPARRARVRGRRRASPAHLRVRAESRAGAPRRAESRKATRAFGGPPCNRRRRPRRDRARERVGRQHTSRGFPLAGGFFRSDRTFHRETRG